MGRIRDTLRLSNVALETPPFSSTTFLNIPIKTSISGKFPIATFDYQRIFMALAGFSNILLGKKSINGDPIGYSWGVYNGI